MKRKILVYSFLLAWGDGNSKLRFFDDKTWFTETASDELIRKHLPHNIDILKIDRLVPRNAEALSYLEPLLESLREAEPVTVTIDRSTARRFVDVLVDGEVGVDALCEVAKKIAEALE